MIVDHSRDYLTTGMPALATSAVSSAIIVGDLFAPRLFGERKLEWPPKEAITGYGSPSPSKIKLRTYNSKRNVDVESNSEMRPWR